MFTATLHRITGQRSDFATCAACGRLRWAYTLERCPANGEYRGRSIPRGSVVCADHAVLFQPETRAILRAVRGA